jgi:F-type H+-transporting ATPase subunit c
MSAIGMIAIASGIAALCGGIVAIGMGLALGKSAEAIARQPEAAGKINSSLLFGLILMETCAIYALLVAILMIFVLAGGA